MHLDRLGRARTAAFGPGDLDAFLITHPVNIRYLTGLLVSTGAFLLTRSGAVLVVDGRYATAARSRLGADISVIIAEGSLDTALAAALDELDPVRVGIEADHLTVSRFSQLESHGRRKGWECAQTSGVIERLREVKDQVELDILREAGRRLSVVARQLRELVSEGVSEREVAAAIDGAVRAAGFERMAFDTIVASGPNAALPHARPTTRRLASGEGVVLDFGGVYDGYCVDLTRTLHLGPEGPEFRRLFVAVREAHAAAVAAVRPGALPSAIDRAARDVLETHGLGAAFTHGTGHGLGLEVHEGPRISKAAPAVPVACGMVFTIEPGVYVPGQGGVRIEDDVLVVDGGCELLTDVPIEL